MTKAQTAKPSEFVIEVEFDPTNNPGAFTSVCGLTSGGLNRSKNVDTIEVPDCDDEDKPMDEEHEVRSSSFSISGAGVWARQSNTKMLKWFNENTKLKTRVRNKNVEDNGVVGDIYMEEGLGTLVTLNNQKERGSRVSAEIEIKLDGPIVATEKAA